MNLSNETLRLKFRNDIYLPLTWKWRRKKLTICDFTIISNNCWGGTVYESYGLKKASPTVGMFIMPADYLKLISNLKYYVNQPLEFISPEESKWKSSLEKKSNWKTYLIARLDDIELHMLHHHDEKTAREKWEKRIDRINWDKLIFKFNDQNGATREDIEKYLEIPLKNKLCFAAKKEMKIDSRVILIKQPGDTSGGIKASREPFGKSKYLDLTEYINNIL